MKKPEVIDTGFKIPEPMLWALDLPVEEMPISEIADNLDIPYLEREGTDDWNLSIRELIDNFDNEPHHAKQAMAADLAFPIELYCHNGQWIILDGVHRLTKAVRESRDTILVRRIPRSEIVGGKMTRAEILTMIDMLLPRMPEMDFALLGTCNLYIQGITELVPNDFDIITNDEGIRIIADTNGSEIFTEGEPGYLETQFDLNGIEIHFVSTDRNPLRPDNFQDFTTIINFEGREVPCLTLSSEYDAYSQMGREKDKRKIELIKARI